MAITVAAGVIVCCFGLQKRPERVSRFLMGALFLPIIVLAIHSFLLPGAKEGLRFYLVPDLETVKQVGLGKVIAAAMNQSFFTLSLGIAVMESFGSDMSRENPLLGGGAHICALGCNSLKDIHPIGGRDVLDSEDFLAGSILLLGSLVYHLFCDPR